MNKKKLIYCLLVCLISILNYSQKIKEQNKTWLALQVKMKLDRHWSLAYDMNNVSETTNSYRPSVNYTFSNKNNFTSTLGYAFFKNLNSEINYEHRYWGQINFQKKDLTCELNNRFRYENRNFYSVEDSKLFSYNRLRYQIQLKKVIFESNTNPTKIDFILADELLMNLGDEIKNNYQMDQNRFDVGFALNFNKVTFQANYQNQFVKPINYENQFIMNHVLKFIMAYSIDI